MAITQRQSSRGGVNKSYPMPVGSTGWNRFDPLSRMPESDAIVMDNFYPNQGSTDLRNGYEVWATGMGGAVESLYEWSGATSRKLISAAGGKIWDATLKAAATQLKLGFTNNRWQGVNFKGRLFLVNGADAPQDFDGTTVNSTAWTGPASINSLVNVNSYRNRLYFVQGNTAKIWYGGIEAITGALTEFDLSAAGRIGGSLMLMATWTQGTETGANEFAVFVMDTGECLIYSGAYPAAADWSLIGRFKLGTPMGRRAAFNTGSQLLLITNTGVEDFSTLIQVGIENAGTAISRKITNAFTDVVKIYGNLFGWQGIYYPKGTRILINVPISTNTTQYQYVMNTANRAWCRFKNQNANCWSLLNDDIYFGGNNGTVYHADFGQSDAGANIEGYLKTAFSYLGSNPSTKKKLNMLRPVILADAVVSPAFGISRDFSPDDSVDGTPTVGTSGGTFWDEGFWDLSDWAGGFVVNDEWTSIDGICYCMAVKCQVATNSVSISIQTFDILYLEGGFI